MNNPVILTDIDGVCLDWEHSFNTWMLQRGFIKTVNGDSAYSITKRYGIKDVAQASQLVKTFNESAAIAFLPALRDSVHYIKKLHEDHGFVFHCITSLSTDIHAQELRKMNLKRVFGDTVFEKFVFLDTGADKDHALAPYRDSGYYWIEDKYVNYQTGLDLGLNSILMLHDHNRQFINETGYFVNDWHSIYSLITHDA